MNFKNIWLITVREYLTQVKKKQFLILTVFAPLLLAAFSALVFYMVQANRSQTVIQVADSSGQFAPFLHTDDDVRYVLVNQADAQAQKAKLTESETVDGVLIIPQLVNQDFDLLQKQSQLIVNDNVGFETKSKIVEDLSAGLRELRGKSLGISPSNLEKLSADFDLNSQTAGDASSDSDLKFGIKYILGLFLMYVTFMFILMYGVRVMRSVLEEKNNRVVEIIISSVKPFDLMIGKILGVTFVALTQFAVWITMSVVAAILINANLSSISSNMRTDTEGAPVAEIEKMIVDASQVLLSMNVPLVIFVFLFFFLFGYIFYSSMYAAIGSMVDNETETSQFSMFTIIPLMLGMYGSLSIVNNPDGPLGFWLSVFPLTSPVAMIARIPFGVPAWELILSMVLLVGSSLLMVWLAAKIYRIGILTYGSKATWKEIWRWLRQ